MILKFHFDNLFFLLILLDFLTKLIILYSNISANKNEFIVKLSYPFDSCNPFDLSHIASCIWISRIHLSTLTRFYHTGDFWRYTQVTYHVKNISGLAFLCILVSKNNINWSRHGPCWNFGWILLNTNFLKICKSRSA